MLRILILSNRCPCKILDMFLRHFIIFFISFTGCVAVDEKNQGSEKSVISNIEKQLRKSPARKPPPDNMRLQDYAKYRNGQNAQRQNREVLVDNFIRGLGVDGF